MYKFRPSRVPYPKSTAALGAEMPPPGTLLNPSSVGILDSCLVHADVLLSFDLQRLVVSTQVNGIATAAISLPTDRAITQVEWIGMRGMHGEAYATAMT